MVLDQLDSNKCYFCHSEYCKETFWLIGNIIDDEKIWICYDCASKTNVDEWLASKGLRVYHDRQDRMEINN